LSSVGKNEAIGDKNATNVQIQHPEVNVIMVTFYFWEKYSYMHHHYPAIWPVQAVLSLVTCGQPQKGSSSMKNLKSINFYLPLAYLTKAERFSTTEKRVGYYTENEET
jgi:hypothetical protein